MAKTITINNNELTDNAYSTSLSSSATAAEGTLTVYSISNLAVDNILILGDFGSEGAEIIKTHAETSPSGTTVTLASNLVKSHSKDTKVTVIPYDQVQFYNATAATGDKTQCGSNVNVNAESNDTKYTDTTYGSGYYFVRFYDSINGNHSDYSDPIPYGGLSANTAGYVINSAMNEMKKEFTDDLTFQMLLDEINSCLRYVRGKLKRWSNLQEYDYVLDQQNRGEYKWALPTDYYDKNSNRSMLQVRVDDHLTYADKTEFNEYFEDVVMTQVATQAEVGATSLVLDSTDDLPETGTIHYYIGNTQYSVAYTANDQSTNTLTTAALTVQTPVDTNIWYGESEDTPYYYSVWDGYLYIWPLCGASNYGKNIVLDYYTDIVEINSDADEITLARHDMVKHWLKWQIRNITENNGKLDFNDGDWLFFREILSDAIRRESSGQKYKWLYNINGIFYKGEKSRNIPFDKS
jgi:hypothetical protein